jgi:osmotically-inducible protein OsmY
MSVLCGAMLASLSGCVALVAGGAISGTLAATDRRTFGAQTEDRAIEVKGASRSTTWAAMLRTSTSTASTAAPC